MRKEGRYTDTDLSLHVVADGDDGILGELQEPGNLAGHDVHCSLRDHPHSLLLLCSSVDIRAYRTAMGHTTEHSKHSFCNSTLLEFHWLTAFFL